MVSSRHLLINNFHNTNFLIKKIDFIYVVNIIYSKYERSLIFSWPQYFVDYVTYAPTKDPWHFLTIISMTLTQETMLYIIS